MKLADDCNVANQIRLLGKSSHEVKLVDTP